MGQELLYTSAPRGLKPGSRGFCTVLSTHGMPAPLATAVEALSGYRPIYPANDSQAALNPVVYSHLKLQATGRTWHVLSRIADYGLDYSQRANKLAHHVILDNPSEKLSGGPANLLSMPGFMRTEWSGDPKVVDLKPIKHEPSGPSGVCRHWQQMTGDAGWAGVLAESFLKDPDRLVILLFKPGQQILPLIAEAIALLPPEERWNVTFSTYFTGLVTGTTCQWRAILHNSKEAHESLRFVTALRIDLTQSAIGTASGNELVEAARTGKGVSTSDPPSLSRQSTASEPPLLPESSPNRRSEIKAPKYAPPIPPGSEQQVRPTTRRKKNRNVLLPAIVGSIVLLSMTIAIPLANRLIRKSETEERENTTTSVKDQRDKPSIAVRSEELSNGIPADRLASSEATSQPVAAEETESAVGGTTTGAVHPAEDDPPISPQVPRHIKRSSLRVDTTPTVVIPLNDHSSQINNIHSYKWQNLTPLPSPKEFHELAVAQRGDPQILQRMKITPHLTTLLAPTWLKWSRRLPFAKEHNTSVLCFFEPTELEPTSAQTFASFHVVTHDDSMVEYVLRTDANRVDKTRFLKWCGVEITEPVPAPQLLKRVFFHAPFKPSKTQRTFDVKQTKLTWTLDLPIDEQRQPELTLEYLNIRFDDQSTFEPPEQTKLSKRRSFDMDLLTRSFKEKLDVSELDPASLAIEVSTTPGSLIITLSLNRMFGAEGLASRAEKKLDSKRSALSAKNYDSFSQIAKSLVDATRENVTATDYSKKVAKSIADFLEDASSEINRQDPTSQVDQQKKREHLIELHKRLDEFSKDVELLHHHYQILNELKRSLKSASLSEIAISYELRAVTEKTPELSVLTRRLVDFGEDDLVTSDTREAKP